MEFKVGHKVRKHGETAVGTVIHVGNPSRHGEVWLVVKWEDGRETMTIAEFPMEIVA